MSSKSRKGRTTSSNSRHNAPSGAAPYNNNPPPQPAATVYNNANTYDLTGMYTNNVAPGYNGGFYNGGGGGYGANYYASPPVPPAAYGYNNTGLQAYGSYNPDMYATTQQQQQQQQHLQQAAPTPMQQQEYSEPPHELVQKVNDYTNDTINRYLPCVAFLVQAQQDLRIGLDLSIKQRFPARQFYTRYIEHLPSWFAQMFRRRMDPVNCDLAASDLQQLTQDALAAERQGAEGMKNAFLGGMKEGESWGLRRWLSKHGFGLNICNNLEEVLQKLQKMDRSDKLTVELGKQIRVVAKASLERLRADVPKAYQAVSTAHPYLPFFHRLEAVLEGLSWFDPEDDDVILLDDDEVPQKEPKPDPVVSTPIFKSSSATEETNIENNNNKNNKRPSEDQTSASTVNGESKTLYEDDSDVEVVEVKASATSDESSNLISNGGSNEAGRLPDKKRQRCSSPVGKDGFFGTTKPANTSNNASQTATAATTVSTKESAVIKNNGSWECDTCAYVNAAHMIQCEICNSIPRTRHNQQAPPILPPTGTAATAPPMNNLNYRNNASRLEDFIIPQRIELAQNLAQVVEILDCGDRSSCENFWDREWKFVMYLFVLILRHRKAIWCVELFDDLQQYFSSPNIRSKIKDPLSLQCVLNALQNRDPERRGIIEITNCQPLNVCAMQDLLEAIDLVFCNTMLYFKDVPNNSVRKETMEVRRIFWSELQRKCQDKKLLPHKIKEKSVGVKGSR